MRVADSNIVDLIKEVHVRKEATYYFFECFIISEINPGVVYTWELAEKVISLAETFYGKDTKVSYITNRIHDYSIKPTDWLKFYKKNYSVNSYAIVSNTKQGYFNASIERMFLKNTNVERFSDLNEAINWTRHMNFNAFPKSKCQ